ncbi:MAG: DUF2249 domain-containing protein [Burkholderiaceae bacterium]
MENKITLDVRGLEPPEPLERVLDALSSLRPDQQLSMLIDREPFPLYRILDANGFNHQTNPMQDFSYEVFIWHKS